MDESFMSIGSFDEEAILNEALNSSPKNDSEKMNVSGEPSTNSIDISGLLNAPLEDVPTKAKLEFTDETPKHAGCTNPRRKRKNFARRCLSTDLNGDLANEDNRMSFLEFRQAKELKMTHEPFFPLKNQSILSSIENTISPIKSGRNCENQIELTPEFDNLKTSKTIENKVIARVPLKVTTNQHKDGVPLQKCYSENHASIMRALQVSTSDPTLIGDFSAPYALPLLTNSKHTDLKSISCHVLADLINGQYNDIIASFTIVDCRYPYEYEGGHIQNAINVYTQEHIQSRFLSNGTKVAEPSTANSKRNIMIFHCEFSSERGPSLCRFLRNKDRTKNTSVYPRLHYPELYLLEGGYKEFFTHHSNLCSPRAYMPMHAKEHENDLRKYRSIVKSHSFDIKFSAYKRNFRL